MRISSQVATWVLPAAVILASFCLTVQHRKELQSIREELKEQKALWHAHAQRQLYVPEKPDSSSRKRYLYVKDAVGDGVTDDTKAINKALRKAYKGKSDATVVLPKGNFLITKQLTIKGGVTLQGQGYGPNPLQLQFDHGGSVLLYCGNEYAFKVTGHSASIQKVAIFDYNGKRLSFVELSCATCHGFSI